jgi:alpha-galactosidase
MKLLFYFIMITVLTSCNQRKDAGVICTLNSKLVTIRNAGTSLSVDNDIGFAITYKKNDEQIQLTAENDGNTSIFLIDSVNNRVTFTRRAAGIVEINDQYGEGKSIGIEAESDDKRLKCSISLTSYNKFPDVILVRSSFKNISEKNYQCIGYKLNQFSLQPSSDKKGWWSFQGAAYRWGQDFVFKLPDSFKRENYMGLNAIRAGGGIPLIDIWNYNFGLALACLSNKPEPISLPVESENGVIHLDIESKFENRTILPDDSLVTVQTAIIVHNNDFYEPLRTYSGLMKPLLPDFQKPVDSGYQPEWCTWGYNQNFKPEQILNKLDTLRALGIRSVILDDGWSLNHGDWIPDPRKFPAGDVDFKELIKKLHENGFKVWLWWVPGYVDSISSVAALHPDWLIMNENGSVHPSYGLCPAYAPVQDHFKKLVRKFAEEYMLDGFKLDFGEINSAPPCYNPKHQHDDAFESYFSTPELFKNICQTARQYNPQMLFEYCACGIPPNIFHLPYANIAVTSDPNISQITNRIKMYKALMGDDFPVLEEYCGVLAGPLYQLTIGTGGVPGTFSTYLDAYHEKWQKIYQKHQLSRGKYLNLYDIGFDYPEAHAIKKDDRYFYAFYTHPWKQLEARRWFRFGKEFDSRVEGKIEFKFPEEPYSGRIELRGLDSNKKYRIVDYENDRDLGIINGNEPFLDVSFVNNLLLEVIPVN